MKEATQLIKWGQTEVIKTTPMSTLPGRHWSCIDIQLNMSSFYSLKKRIKGQRKVACCTDCKAH